MDESSEYSPFESSDEKYDYSSDFSPNSTEMDESSEYSPFED